MDLELVPGKSLLQVRFEREPLHDFVPHLGVEQLKGRFPAALGDVHGNVGIAQDVFRAPVTEPAQDDPDACARSRCRGGRA